MALYTVIYNEQKPLYTHTLYYICSTKNISSTRCLIMGKIIRSTIDFLYVKRNRLSAHKLPMIRPPSGTFYLTYNVTLRQLVSGCLGIYNIIILLNY